MPLVTVVSTWDGIIDELQQHRDRTIDTMKGLPNDTPDAEVDKCYVPDAQNELDATEIEFRVDFDALIGGDCEANDEGARLSVERMLAVPRD